MELYELTGYFDNSNDFKFSLQNYPAIIDYEYGWLKYDINKYRTCERPISTLDVFNTGLLEINNPQVSIYTMEKDKIEFYKKSIIHMIKENLEQSKNTTQEQFEALERFIGINVSKSNTNKVHDNGYGVHFCPKCKGSVWQIKDESNYCFRCGQKLEW